MKAAFLLLALCLASLPMKAQLYGAPTRLAIGARIQRSATIDVWHENICLGRWKCVRAELYFNTLVKDRGVKEVLLVDPAGIVKISTNEKNQGISFADRFPANLLQQDEVYFTNEETYQLSAPVMAPGKRLGGLYT